MDSLGGLNGGQTGGSSYWSYSPGEAVTVEAGSSGIVPRPVVTGCESQPGGVCLLDQADFVYLHQHPSASSALVSDPAVEPDGSPSTTDIDDVGARAVDGDDLVVAAVNGDWLGVRWLGKIGWVYNPGGSQVLVPTDFPYGQGYVAKPKPGLGSIPVYGRAFPERSAYPDSVPYRGVTPLSYRWPQGQAYVVADTSVPTDYYDASSLNATPDADHLVIGNDRYDQIWFGHRLVFVRADDVNLLHDNDD